MKIFGVKLFEKRQQRRGDFDFFHPTSAGIYIDDESALRIADVYNCIRILAESIGTLPCLTYKKLSEGGKSRAADFYLYDILHDQPNEFQTAPEFWEMMVGHAALTGNAYARIFSDFRGRITEIVPIQPEFITPFRLDSGKIAFRYRTPDGTQSVIPSSEIFRFQLISRDGVSGMSPLEQARETFGATKATEDFGSKFFANAAKPAGILSHPGKLTEESAKRLQKSWQDAHAGSQNAFKTAVLEEGMQWTQLTLSNEDAQFLQSRKFNRSQIAAIFRIPPHMLGDLERATFSNIEHQGIEFVTHTLRPWLVKIEAAIKRDLLTPTERKKYFAEFLVDGLLRGDTLTRYQAYAIGRTNGWLSANDVREKENMNPLPEGGDKYLVPLNMVDSTDQQAAQPDPQVDQTPDPAADPAQRAIAIELNIENNFESKPEKRNVRTWRDKDGHVHAEISDASGG